MNHYILIFSALNIAVLLLCSVSLRGIIQEEGKLIRSYYSRFAEIYKIEEDGKRNV